jgi:hypothetical protein
MAWRFRLAFLTLLPLAPAQAQAQAQAQVNYNGWNLGPDYSAMLRESQRQDALLTQRLQQQQMQVVQQVSQDPRAQALYRQHLARGGQLSFPQFAYQYAATGGFTPEGIARYRRSEAYNQRREHEAWAGLMQAEQDRSAAMLGLQESYGRGQYNAGLNLQGQASYIDPTNGTTRQLPYLQPGTVSRDLHTGQPFMMDQNGHYMAQAQNGTWYYLQPGR